MAAACDASRNTPHHRVQPLIDRIRNQIRSIRSRGVVQLLLAVVVFGAALYYLLHIASGLDFSRVLATITHAKPAPLAVAVACQVGFLLFQGLRWRVLLPKLESISIIRTVGLLSIGNMINMLLPLRSGDLARPFLAVRCAGAPLSRAAAAAIAERALDVVVLGALAVVVPLELNLGPIHVAIALAGGAVLLAWLLRRFAGPYGSDRLAALGMFAWVERACRETVNAFAEITDPRAVLAAVAWTIVSFAFAIGTYFFALLVLDLIVPASALLSLFVITQFGAAIPSAPASIGVFDALAVALLISSGVSEQEAFSGAILLHAVLVAVPLSFGLAATAWEGWSLRRDVALARLGRSLDSGRT